MPKTPLFTDYRLWLLADASGHIGITGWSETHTDTNNAQAPTKIDHWPTYALCSDRAQLPGRLLELGLTLAPGADLNDLDKSWDVYLRHPDITALRTQLARERNASD